MAKDIIVIGAGFAGLSAAAYLSKSGYNVTIVEKNDSIGGRSRQFKQDGFVFDMGPSWYWMPEVFEQFYQDFGFQVSDFYQLDRLDPSYQVIWDKSSETKLSPDLEALYQMFESEEKGAGAKLKQFLEEAKEKYEIGMADFVERPYLSWGEMLDYRLATKSLKLDVWKSVSSHVRKLFKNDKLRQILEFPVLFLGATPQKIPALYTMMNYADMGKGTWYPQGGMFEVIKAFESICIQNGVKIVTAAEVMSFDFDESGKKVTAVNTVSGTLPADVIVASGDYHHIEQRLLPKHLATYNESYWDKRVMAPSCLLYYVGVNKKLPKLLHHNLFFDADFSLHAKEIYETHEWPKDPLFYVCCPSKTDTTVAPEESENVFLLIPVSTEIEDTEEERVRYFDQTMERLEAYVGTDIRNNVVYKRSYASSDFKADYHAFKGNAYGLANTLLQTAKLKPTMKNKKLDNFYYAGQLTVPGPGVPPSIISGRMAADLIKQNHPLSIHQSL